MLIKIQTRKDALRHVADRVAIAVSVTVAVSWIMSSLELGTDPNATVRVGFVTVSIIVIGAIVAALLTGVLTYRSALTLQELTLARAELLRLSQTDQLTGLLNRRGFDESAVLTLAEAREANVPIVALMCDIDRFKSINDEFGHEFGDRVLVEIGCVLRSFAEETDILIARHGGEEFAALMIGVGKAQAMMYAETLHRLCAIEVSHETATTQVTVSIGLTSPIHVTDLTNVMRLADQALYKAKHGGRNRVVQLTLPVKLVAA